MTGFIILIMTALAFIITGHYMVRKPAAEINHYYGYRTKKSRSSQEAWDFSQKFSAEWMIKAGYGMGIFSALFLLFPDSTFSMILSIVLTTIGCIIPIYLTEDELKKRFH